MTEPLRLPRANYSINRGCFQPDRLRLIAPAPPPDHPPLRIGDRCHLNSDLVGLVSPLLVVDLTGDELTVAWPKAGGGADEAQLPRACLRRA